MEAVENMAAEEDEAVTEVAMEATAKDDKQYDVYHRKPKTKSGVFLNVERKRIISVR
ncbi:hypothetical protein X975_17452, partial [Stegodyphus mimosarum]